MATVTVRPRNPKAELTLRAASRQGDASNGTLAWRELLPENRAVESAFAVLRRRVSEHRNLIGWTIVFTLWAAFWLLVGLAL